VSTLWHLKQLAKEHPLPGIPYIHFNSLLRQPDYRHEVLDAALRSGNDQMESLARQAREMDVEQAALLNPDDKRWLEQRDRQIAAAYESELESQSRAKRRYAQISIAIVIALVAGIGAWIVIDRFTGDVVVRGALAGEQRWSVGRDYVLDGIVTVPSGARLTIESGVRVTGRPGSALVVTRGGFLHAKGTATQPIVFTSAQPTGKRQPGDWGGLVLLGAAPINTGASVIEGFASGDPRGAYGGNSPEHPCGVLEYARVEFAGFEALADNELNGLTLGGCGSDTIIRSVQVHRALDDGVEVFGGTVNLSRILITQAGDDALDWDQGWVGNLQFLITQQTETGDNAFEGDSSVERPDAPPVSSPTIFNATLIGADTGAQRAMTLRSGTGGLFGNILARGFAVEFADIQGTATPAAIRDGRLRFETVLMDQIGGRNAAPFIAESGDQDNDGGFDEANFFLRQIETLTTDPALRLPVRSQNATNPDFVPSGRAEISAARLPAGEFWEESATFPGAIRPGESTPWYAGWTEFPRD
jgi:hypothetical protein